jgi:hypothetical protein
MGFLQMVREVVPEGDVHAAELPEIESMKLWLSKLLILLASQEGI